MHIYVYTYLNSFGAASSTVAHFEHVAFAQLLVHFTLFGLESGRVTTGIDDQSSTEYGHEMSGFFALGDANLDGTAVHFVVQFDCFDTHDALLILAWCDTLKRKWIQV